MSESRTKNAIKNMKYTAFLLLLYYIVSFVCRTVFTYLLGTEYLGIQGLFSNILMILSFAELGMGDALVYLLYSPLYYNDKSSVKKYLRFCRTIYTIIIAIIIVVGVLLLPFVEDIVGKQYIDENITIIYLLYLVNTVMSYVCIYKKTILIADQKKYVVTFYTQVFNIIMNISQIIVLYYTHNFYLYLIALIICTLLNNVLCSKKASELYPYINEKNVEEVSGDERRQFLKNVKGLFLGKISALSFEATDNIFITMFVSLRSVGVFSNYTLITITVNSFINQIISSLTPVIGNLGVNSSKEKKKNVFDILYFTTNLLYGLFATGFCILLNDFVGKIWLTKEYYLSESIVILLVIELFLRGENIPFVTYRDAMGFFSEYKMINVIAAAMNIVLDIFLGKFFGMIGIILATIISKTIVRCINVFVVYKNVFSMGTYLYFKVHFKWIIFLSIEFLIDRFIYCYLKNSIFNQYAFFIVMCLIIIVNYCVGVLTFWFQSDELKFYEKKIRERK